jgi:hypothetical protein
VRAHLTAYQRPNAQDDTTQRSPWTTCHCGTAYDPAYATLANTQECNVGCYAPPSGSNPICGGYNGRITLFSSAPPSVPPGLPAGWRVSHACAVDGAQRVLAGDTVATLADNTPAACAARCAASQMFYAGVEYGNECHRTTGYATAGAQDVNV